MTKYSQFNVVYRLQKWMDSVAGQTFLNYAYSWGASVVILGTLFKLTHLPGANFFLFLGMGTEVFVFFISAFDRPFDKTTDGMELQRDSQLKNETNQSDTASKRTDDYSVRRGMQADILQRTEEQLNNAQQLSSRLPDNEESIELKNTLAALQEIYRLQLTKSSGQLSTIDDIDAQLKMLSKNLNELNTLYQRMINAVKVKE